ncbi:reverse transcriptase family protein [Devosia indica]
MAYDIILGLPWLDKENPDMQFRERTICVQRGQHQVRDLIKPSESSWGAPILFAPKKDGGLRMCIDYRWLNQRTIRNRYPLPLPDELLNRVHGVKVFSRLDLRSGYWQMPICPDQDKTAFWTRYGHYGFKAVPFGLTNAPPQFMAMINDIFRDFHDEFLIVFLIDIIVYSKNMEDHARHLKLVLERLDSSHWSSIP